MEKDIKMIKTSVKTVTPADKTTNVYCLSREEYEKLISKSITKSYKKASPKIADRINEQNKELLKDEQMVNRFEINQKSGCFITLKDHKENFSNNPTTRLINPAKNETGRISKAILDRINTDINKKLSLNQWKNTQGVIEWFKKIKNKTKCKFVTFDVKDFYPSISETLLKDAIAFATMQTSVTKREKAIITQARKSLLFTKDETWIKRDGGLFDVTMGAYDGAEVCELVGCFILTQLAEHLDVQNIGLYRDDGLASFANKSGPEMERIKKIIQQTFKKNKLEITIQANLTVVDYLDVTMNLRDDSYKPYTKPDNNILYIHKDSNHPRSVTKQLPTSIEKRLSTLSCNEKVFNESKPAYEEALRRSGYNVELKYAKQDTKENRNRKRNVIWFNPPFTSSVQTNIARKFLALIEKHFPPAHKFRKLFNKNNLKVSYSCMPSMKSIITAHNKKILTKSDGEAEQRTCNCARGKTCPLDGKCLSKNIVYKATISTENIDAIKVYYGACSTTFKDRLANHKKSFKNEEYRHETELSNEFWRTKKKRKKEPIVKWEIAQRCSAYNQTTGRCTLCLHEKLKIATHAGNNLLNKRNELVSKCRHQGKYALSKFDARDTCAL